MKRVILVLASLALGACSSLKTSWDYDPEINFSQYKTYAWVQQQTVEASYHLDGLMEHRVKDAVNAQLQTKGFKMVAPSAADVLVNYLTKIDQKIDVDTFSNDFGYHPYYGPGWGWSGQLHTQTRVREYEVGTLIIDIIDNQTDKLIWRGALADTIRENKTPQQRVEDVNKAVGAIMLNYPPKPVTE